MHTGFNPRVSVDYTISLPPTVVLQRIESSNGGIELAGVRVTETELLTSNGRVIVHDAPGGDLAATSSNGRIELSGVEGYVTATTSNAGITVEDCGGVAGLSTSNGAISAKIPAVRGGRDDIVEQCRHHAQVCRGSGCPAGRHHLERQDSGSRSSAPTRRVDGYLGLGNARQRGADRHRHNLERRHRPLRPPLTGAPPPRNLLSPPPHIPSSIR
ncbi:DUF4097 domain-containing protein [Methanoculleus chikugoensis]|uniref:DUF4097 domain-containing protein n=1 Tax=Methanoculleus chikugoensis TaxID=118126 RepID=UPI001FB504A2|nr:DUF4097 domain-containing protein [Methanoculleus chikugoensis]